MKSFKTLWRPGCKRKINTFIEHEVGKRKRWECKSHEEWHLLSSDIRTLHFTPRWRMWIPVSWGRWKGVNGHTSENQLWAELYLEGHSDFRVKNTSGILRQSAICTQGMLVRKPVILAAVAGSPVQGSWERVGEGCEMAEAWEMGIGFAIHMPVCFLIQVLQGLYFYTGFKNW